MPFSLSSHYCNPNHAPHRFLRVGQLEKVDKKKTLFIFPNQAGKEHFETTFPNGVALSLSDLISQPIHSQPKPPKTIWVLNNYQDYEYYSIRLQEAHRTRDLNFQGEWYQDVWFSPEYTFGLELELSAADFKPSANWKKYQWRDRAVAILNILKGIFSTDQVAKKPSFLADSRYRVWQVIYDESTGWEIVSPVLRGQFGLEQVQKLIAGLSQISALGLKMSHNTGCHIHLGWSFGLSALKRLLHWFFFFEPSLGTLVHPQRLAALHRGYFSRTKINAHCIPIAQNLTGTQILEARSIQELCTHIPRNSSINIHSILSLGTIEFRMLEATQDPQLLLLWISLCQQLLHRAEKEEMYPPIPKNWDACPIDPSGDMYMLAKAFLPGGTASSHLQLINNRRYQIAAYWCRNRTLHPWLSYIQRWNYKSD